MVSWCYPLLLVCLHQVRLQFETFDVEWQPSCLYDRLDVYDGADMTSDHMGSFCNANPPGTLTSTGNTVLLHLSTDFSITRQGFKILYSQVTDDDDGDDDEDNGGNGNTGIDAWLHIYHNRFSH